MCALARRQRSSTKRSTVPGVLESTEREEYPASYASLEEYPVAVGTLPKPPRPSLKLPSYGFPPAGSARRSLDGRSAMTHPSFQVNYFPSDQSVASCVDPGSEADESSTQFSDADDVSSSMASSHY
ncbi:uncharacterized protein [Littorina saxatilis]|uniref:uncharacterized protein n=1 Tax=Littorina saxatilis TaxID=31220 RepID=UPI0038B584A1